jgi:hypothetical protein
MSGVVVTFKGQGSRRIIAWLKADGMQTARVCYRYTLLIHGFSRQSFFGR